jgi:hypothetical protein
MTKSSVGGKPVDSDSRRRLIGWGCAAFLAVQILIPLWLLPNAHNTPFGWQMYSSVASAQFHVEFADGSRRLADPADHVLRHRSDIDYSDALPALLCDKFPRATRVVITDVLNKSSKTVPCDR